MFKAKKLTRNFAQGSLFRPLGHSRQFFVGAMTATGVLGVVAFGLMTKSSIESHVMPEKATDSSAQATVFQGHATSQTAAKVSPTATPVNDQQPTTSQPIPVPAETVQETTPVTSQSQSKPVATPEARQAAKAAVSAPKQGVTPAVDLSTLGVRVVTGVDVVL